MMPISTGFGVNQRGPKSGQGKLADLDALNLDSQPYTIFLLNDDMELNRYRKTFIQKMLKELQA
jgi:hypothetical protein